MDISSLGHKNRALAAFACSIVGMLFVLASLVPFERLLPQTSWTEKDSETYDRVTSEYKRTAFQDPTEMGLTNEAYASRLENLKQANDALRKKLVHAQHRGEAWSQRLWWAGVAITLLGALLHFGQRILSG